MAERRVVNTAARSASGAARGLSAGTATETVAPPKKRTGLLVAVVVLLTLVLAGGGYVVYTVVLSDDDGSGVVAEATPPEPGEVIAVDSVSVNLAGGHYLRLGFSMQMTVDAGTIELARAQDIAISLFSGRQLEEVNSDETREELKATLVERLAEAFDGGVMDVYLTDFVTQ